MKRKTIASALCVSLIAASLVGCGSTGSAQSTTSDTTVAAAASSVAAATAASSESATTESSADAAATTQASHSVTPASTSGDYDASGDPAVELIFTSVSVTGDSHTTAMTAFADKVKELSGGSVTCKTYSDGTLFSADAEWDALSGGQADIAYVSFPTLATQKGLEWCSMIGSAYFWSSYEHMTNTLNGDIGEKEVFTKLEEATNAVPLSAFYLGSRVINTRSKAINQWSDMNGLLLRMPNSETWLNLGSALGANPTPLAFSELYTALQTGAVDGQDNPLPTDVSAKFYEVAPYIAITNHVVDSIIPMINKDTWNGMTESQQLAVSDAMDYARQVNDEARISEEDKDIQILTDNGCTITYPDINDFKTHAKEYYDSNPDQEAAWDMDLYKEIEATADQY